MRFKPNSVYYLYNTGNNFEPIFFNEHNKRYFKKKIFKYLAPHAKIIYFSLAPNQFHILIRTKKDLTSSALSDNLGIMLRSYTRSINNQESRVGSLFRKGTRSFEKISDIPIYLRNFLFPYLIFKGRTRMVDFPKSILSFLQAINDKLRSINISSEPFPSLLHCLFHPLKPENNYRNNGRIVLSRILKGKSKDLNSFLGLSP